MEGKTLFLAAGGKEYRYISCLNERDDWIAALADLVLDNLGGWITTPPDANMRQLRAQACGAKQ